MAAGSNDHGVPHEDGTPTHPRHDVRVIAGKGVDRLRHGTRAQAHQEALYVNKAETKRLGDRMMQLAVSDSAACVPQNFFDLLNSIPAAGQLHIVDIVDDMNGVRFGQAGRRKQL